VNFPNPHAKIDEENQARDRRTAAVIRVWPELIQLARNNLERWLRLDGNRAHPALMEWRAIMDFLTPEEIANFLESDTPKANRLRQSSPFIGFPTVDELQTTTA
jgi:hypothetical protein